MNVCFVSDSLSTGGSERVICNLANYLSKSNKVSIILTASKRSNFLYNLDKTISVIYVTDKKKKISKFKKVYCLRKEIRQHEFDIVISFHPHVTIYSYLAIRKLKIPFLVSERNDPRYDRLNFIFKYLKKRAFKYADACIFQTRQSFELYNFIKENKKIILKNPLVSFNNGFRYLNIINRKHVIVSAGRIVEQKIFKLLLKAFAIFSKTHSDFVLKIYGDGPLKEQLIKYCQELNIHDKVVFNGFNTNWLRDNYDSSMFVLTSNFEGMPNVLLEAMSLGIPSISSDCPIGGPREVIRDGINGLLFNVGSCDELVSRMEMVCNSPEFSQKLSKNSYCFMKREYEPSKVYKDWELVIKRVIENYGKR